MKKRYFDFPITSLVGLVCVIISLFVLVVSLPTSDDKYICFNKTVEAVFVETDAMHFKFIEDDTDYVFYEYGDVSFEDLSDIKNGDAVSIYVEKNYKKFERAIVYKLTAEDQVIYDSLEYYYHRDMAIVNVFAPTVIGLLITYALIFVFSIKAKANNDESSEIDFKIKNPEHHISVGVIFSVFGIVPFSSFLIQYLRELISADLFIISYAFLLIAAIGLLLVYVTIVESFKLKNDEYTYRHPFRKQSLRIEQIDHVEIYLTSLTLCKVTFYDMNGKKAITFRDNGLAFSNGFFIRSLKINNIRYEYKTKTVVIYK